MENTMNPEPEKIYLDMELINKKYCGTGLIFAIELDNRASKPEIIVTGKSIQYSPSNKKNEEVYKILAAEYDVRFIFDDYIPEFEFYPVPRLAIFAIDSLGGCFATTNSSISIGDEEAPIYYVTKNLEVHYLSPNLLNFFEMVVFYPSWKNAIDLSLSMPSVSKQRKEYLCHALNLKNNISTFIQNKNNIVIYPSFIDAKKEIDFYDMQKFLN